MLAVVDVAGLAASDCQWSTEEEKEKKSSQSVLPSPPPDHTPVAPIVHVEVGVGKFMRQQKV